MSKKILIIGDSFAANFDNSLLGWPFLLKNNHNVTNLAQAGCGQYKILQQLRNTDPTQFSNIIISHTSSTRFHIEKNPFHTTGTHIHSDLIYEDVLNKDPSDVRDHILFLFEHVIDIDYQNFIYQAICREIAQLIQQVPTIHLNFFSKNSILKQQFSVNECYQIWRKNTGTINHMSEKGNQIIYNLVEGLL
jgi:hypothetical protein